jgi:hypothetical protein
MTKQTMPQSKGPPVHHTGQEPGKHVAKPGPRDAQTGPTLKGRT